ncbi:MAG: class I SAM-dependent methyltransferase [Methanocellales archaeon]|nr:class I SAM-dependent methyltransferase [Methanocellales archaeon]
MKDDDIKLMYEKEFYAKERNFACKTGLEFDLFIEHLDRILAGKPKNIKILDIGTGSGDILRILKNKGYNNLYGIEIIPEFIKKAEKFGKIIEHDIETDLPFEDDEFGVIITKDLLEHVYNVDNLICEISRVLQKDGIYIQFTLNMMYFMRRFNFLFGKIDENFPSHHKGHVRWVSHKILEKYLSKYFTIEKITLGRIARLPIFSAYPNIFDRFCFFICKLRTEN